MRRTMILAAVWVMALVATACGPTGEGKLRALPQAGGGQGSSAASMRAEDSAATAMAEGLYRPVVYEAAPGLKQVGETAPAYELRSTATKDDVARLAKALGLSGDIETDHEPDFAETIYTVTDAPRRLTVYSSSSAGWDYSVDEGGVGVTASCAVSSEAEVVDCPEPAPMPDLPSASEAEAAARKILDVARVDGVEVSLQSERPTSSGLRVAAHMRVDDRPIVGFETSFLFGSGGKVLYASGGLVRLHKIGDYPLANIATGVKRLNERRYGLGGPEPLLAEDTADAALIDPVAPEPRQVTPAEECPPNANCVAPEPAPGPASEPSLTPAPEPTPEPIDPEVVTITGASLVYLPTAGRCVDDPVVLVPAFAFTTEEGGEVHAEAVVDAYRTPDGADDPTAGVAAPCPEDLDTEDSTKPHDPVIEPRPMPAESKAPDTTN